MLREGGQGRGEEQHVLLRGGPKIGGQEEPGEGDEVFDMLAKAGDTMWTGCQGVKSGRFAQDDRPRMLQRESRVRRHDGCPPCQVHNAPSRP